MSGVDRPERGFLLGKFMPPHEGHVFLCEFARAYVQELTILVCSLPDDPIPGALRLDWMRELFPSCRIRWCTEILPQVPEDDPENFWDKWRTVIRRHHPEPIDIVFASEAYGHRLAAELGARFVPCDSERIVRPCSGTAVRADPFGHWRCIPAPVRPYFVKRVCLFGPESSGKSTLAAQLGAHFDTIVVSEYGRTYTREFGTDVKADDLQLIVRGHLAAVAAAKRQANRVLIEDTDPLMTAIWSDMLLGERADWFATFRDYADLYLLCAIDFPWEDDGTRYFPHPNDRQRFFATCEAELKSRGVTYDVVSGDRGERLRRAIAAIDALLDP